MMPDIAPTVRTFITDNFLFREGLVSLSDDDSFQENGVIDSVGVLELVTFLESAFSIRIADAEVVPANLDSIARITAFVGRKLDAASCEEPAAHAC